MIGNELLENITKVFLEFLIQNIGFLNQIIGMTHHVNHPFMECPIEISVSELDAVCPAVETTINGRLLHDASEHIEVMPLDSTRALNLIQLHQVGEMMQKWSAT